MKTFLKLIFLTISCISLASCGSSPGDRSGNIAPTTPPPPPPPPPVNYDTTEYRNNYGLDQINAIAAYDNGATGEGITVAVIDSGIDVDNSQIVANIHPDSINIVTGQKSDLNDVDGHGTGVAGVIAAIRDPSNTTNVNTQGVAFDAQIMALNTASVGSCESEDGCTFFDSDIAAALDYARVRDVKIVNISLGGDGFNSPVLVNAYRRAVEAGMIIILAAGNRDETDTDFDVAQPENSASVAWAGWANGQIIVAGGVDATSAFWDGSHRAGEIAKDVFLVAGAFKIRSIGVDEDGDAAVFDWDGTSFAAPHISGAAALLMQAFPNLTGKQVADLLFSTATDLGAVGPDIIFGSGLINIEEAFRPQGASSIAVRTAAGDTQVVALESSVLLGGNAFGGFTSFSDGLSNSMMLDGLNRSFRMDLGQQIFDRGQNIQLGSLVESKRGSRTSSLQLDQSTKVNFSWQEDRRFQEVEERYFSHQNNARNRYRGLRMKLTMSMGNNQNMTFSQGLSLKETLEDYDQNEFLSIGKEDFMALFGRNKSQNAIVSHKLNSKTKFNFLFGRSEQEWQEYNLKSNSYVMMARVDHQLFSFANFGLDLGLMNERGSVLGSLSDGAISLGKGATTAFINGRFDMAFAKNFNFFAKASYGMTKVTAADLSLVEQIDNLTSGSFAIGITANSFLQKGDRLSFAVSQPLRVMSGQANLSYVASRNYQTDSLSFIRNQASLSPTGREIDFELAYRIAGLFGAQIDFNILHQINPNHNRENPDNTGVLIRFGSVF
ncbi:hypothetical protein MNBD_ALPHA03-1796 [hydrothermal vent metagenome]|uniref:Peptidase S8/S53 domain-containing protein n=1 Tax=hydrothermal vent metagenome TaxID=652676 RepID=A0A3B1B5B5_9ZZZZ